jgi:hypothetical protein
MEMKPVLETVCILILLVCFCFLAVLGMIKWEQYTHDFYGMPIDQYFQFADTKKWVYVDRYTGCQYWTNWLGEYKGERYYPQTYREMYDPKIQVCGMTLDVAEYGMNGSNAYVVNENLHLERYNNFGPVR